jgi:hypothetical protein
MAADLDAIPAASGTCPRLAVEAIAVGSFGCTLARFAPKARPRRVCESSAGTSQEADMTRRSTVYRSPESSAGAALVGLALVVLFGNLDWAAARSGLARERRWACCPRSWARPRKQ